MDDDEWRDLKEPWQRVKWARQRWQRLTDKPDNAGAAAHALGMKDGTYRAYERPADSSKPTKLQYEQARAFARKFKVNWIWLLSSEQSPFTEEVAGHAVHAMATETKTGFSLPKNVVRDRQSEHEADSEPERFYFAAHGVAPTKLPEDAVLQADLNAGENREIRAALGAITRKLDVLNRDLHALADDVSLLKIEVRALGDRLNGTAKPNDG